MAAPLSAFVGAWRFLSGLNPRGRRYDVSVSGAGRVTVTARVSNARSPGMRVATERAARASEELTQLLAEGTAPSDATLAVVRDFTRDQVDRIDAWTVTHPVIGEPPPEEPPPKRPRPITPPPGKEPGAMLPPAEDENGDLDFSSVLGGEQITPVGAEDFFMPRFTRGLHKSIPGGAAGMAQQAPATLARIGRSLGTGTAGRRGARRARSNGAPRRRARRASPRTRRGARLVKGSPAAKRHMAKLRRMRRKR